jgi:pSer/pThr/pTyr-binding forkhead associated (FHA) protein
VPCPLCGSGNQPNLRFCVSCGHLLARAAPPPAPDLAPIAPARVVDLGAPPAPSRQRLCPRCRGNSDSSAQFCRFCGASLADAVEIAVTPPADVTQTPAMRSPKSVPPASSRARSRPPPAPAVSPDPLRSTATMHSPTPNGPRLVLVARDGGEGPTYPLGETTDLGRAEGHVVLADDRYVSPRHARIARRGGVYFLRDLASTNGIFVRIPFERPFDHDGSRHEAPPLEVPSGDAGNASEGARGVVLADQDLFLVGQQVLKFEVVKDAEEGFGVASDGGTLVFGTPTAPRYARLCQRTVEGVARDVFYVRKIETVIGRESGDVVFTDDPFLSRRHAVVRVQNAPVRRFTLTDLGSSNGTFLQIRQEVRLRNGDHFRIGQQLFRVDLDSLRADA